MFSAFNTFGRMGAAAGAKSLAQQIAAMSPALWLEPSVTNGYQDSAGTTALYMPGAGSADPPVGLALDLSGNGRNASQSTSTARPKLSARRNLLVGTATLATQSVTVTAAAHTIDWSGAGTITASGAHSGALSKGQTFTPSAGTLTLTVSGSVTSASLVLGSSVGTYQAVTDANNYDTAGFPLYWKFDGTDDWLATGNIDLTGTDKVTVVAGLQNASSANYQIPYGNGAVYGPGTQGKFTLNFPSTAGNARGDFGGVSAAAKQSFSITASPTVVTQILDSTTSPYQKIRSNGANVATGLVDLGGQSFANAAIGMGAAVYGGGANPYAGNIYALLIFPRILTAAEIAIVERYVAQKSGVTL